jgi:magnesium-transporting ATPase (P-type)
MIKNHIRKVTGKVEFNPYDSEAPFKGSFKLKTDPRHDEITSANLIPAGTVIRSNFVIGMVIYSGTQSVTFRKSVRRKQASSSGERRIEIFSFITTVLLVFCALICTMTMIVKSDDVYVIDKFDKNRDYIRIFFCFSTYISMLP